MTDRDRLIELMLNAPQIPCIKGGQTTGKQYQTFQNIADYLLANGVIVPPCKVGDKVYLILLHEKVEEFDVAGFCLYPTGLFVQIYYDHQVYSIKTDNVFLTKEEAEEKLKEREQDDR